MLTAVIPLALDVVAGVYMEAGRRDDAIFKPYGN